jgi:hypothetical protein
MHMHMPKTLDSMLVASGAGSLISFGLHCQYTTSRRTRIMLQHCIHTTSAAILAFQSMSCIISKNISSHHAHVEALHLQHQCCSKYNAVQPSSCCLIRSCPISCQNNGGAQPIAVAALPRYRPSRHTTLTLQHCTQTATATVLQYCCATISVVSSTAQPVAVTAREIHLKPCQVCCKTIVRFITHKYCLLRVQIVKGVVDECEFGAGSAGKPQPTLLCIVLECAVDEGGRD